MIKMDDVMKDDELDLDDPLAPTKPVAPLGDDIDPNTVDIDDLIEVEEEEEEGFGDVDAM